MENARRTVPLAILTAAVLAACEGAGPRVGDTAGSSAVGSGVPGWTIGEPLMVGGADAPADALLFGVSGVVEDRSGNFYVLNFGDKRVLGFDRTGKRIREIGREGGGPGEFLAPLSLAATADELVVVDPQADRISRFKLSDGSYVDAVRPTVALGSPMGVQADSAGHLLVQYEPLPDQAPVDGAAPALRAFVARVDPSTGAAEPVVQLDTVPMIQLTARTEGGGGVTRLMEAPFAPRPQWSASRDGEVYYGTGATYEVRMAADGRSIPVLRQDVEPPPVSAADRERYLEVNPYAKAAGEIPFPAFKPHFTHLEVDPDGLLWLQSPSGDAEVVLTIWSADATRLGQVVLPRGTRLLEVARTAFYTVRTDDDGVEAVYRYPVQRG